MRESGSERGNSAARSIPGSLSDGSGITYLKIVNSYDCSRGCSYCYNTLLGQKIQPDPAALRTSLREFFEHGSGPVDVEFIGGEPLQATQIDDTVDLLRRVRREPRVGQVFLSSSIVSSAALSRAMPFVQALYLSVDFSRRYNRKRATDKQLERVVSLAREWDLHVSVSSVLQGDETPEDIEGFATRLMDVGISSWGVTHKGFTRLTDHAVADLVNQYYRLFQLSVSLGGRVEIVGSILDGLKSQVRGLALADACDCAISSAVLEPDGSFSAGVCQDHIVGPQSPQEFGALRSARLLTLRDGDCALCPLWEVCYGGCATEAARLSGSALARSPVECAVLTGLWARVSRDLASLRGSP